MSKIPFKVSARTARLIGRENIATSKGAIIELVKNCSDADSKVCILYFDNKYAVVPAVLSESDNSFLINNGIDKTIISDLYDLKNDTLHIKESLNSELKAKFGEAISQFVSLYIMDAGEGMTQKIITDYWMTIGTDNKAQNIFTKSGKVKAGAKGIGRFALDKLGDLCEMITKFNSSIHQDLNEEGGPSGYEGYKWMVDWRDFEDPSKTIENVEADLYGYETLDFGQHVKEACPVPDIQQIIDKFKFNSGTILKISNLRESWLDFNISRVFEDLQLLVPPEDIENFEIHVFSSLQNADYGLVEGSICDDYDYKLIAKADNNQNVTFTIYRNEYDVSIIDPNFYKRSAISNYPFNKTDLSRGFWSGTKTFGQLAPGINDIDKENIFEKIGAFDFTFYFMKRTYSTPDLEKFNYKRFHSNFRKEWLNKFGGIKLFRDSFRVRPYGEIKNTSFDWLGLGSRKAKSPAAISKPEGGYKVEPENIAGAIRISRIANIDFEDKSSREGLQENKTFLVFKEIIQGIISIFEEDRAYLAKEMVLFFDEKNSEIKDREQAERLVQTILDRRQRERDARINESEQPIENPTDEQKIFSEEPKLDKPITQHDSNQLVILAELSKEKDEKIEKLEDEQKILRGLASSGIVIASFTHELGNLNDVMGSRIDDLQYLISDKLPSEEFNGIPSFLNPYSFMDKMRRQDTKLQNWLKFSLTAARKDKRKRKKIYLASYFESLTETWNTVFTNREITFLVQLNGNDNLALKIFEIDLDSIFNNLIVNSIDAFIAHTEIIDRLISITLSTDQREINIDYVDNGPGLSPDIEKPNKIFEALYTTKRNKHTLEEEGTGLGMWLVSSIIADNDGTKKILFPEKGFGIRIGLPKRYLTE